MRTLIKFALFIVCLLGVPAVHAFQLGAFDIKPIAKIIGMYDDNITSAENDVKRDFSTLFSFGLEGLYDAKTESLKFSGVINHEVFAKEDDYNNTSEDLNLTFKKEFSAYDRIVVDNKFTHADQPRSFEDEFGRSAGRYDYYKNYFTTGFDHDFTEQFTVKLKYANQFYDPSIKTASNSRMNRPGLQADYKFSSKSIGSVYYDYHNYAFDPGGTATKHAPALGWRQYFTEKVYADIKAGFDHINTVTDSSTTQGNYSAGLFHELTETATAGILFSKSHDFNYYSSDLFDNWRVSMFLAKQISERISMNLGLFSGGGKFIQGGTKETFNGASVAAGYDINENVKATISYMISQRDSSAAGDDYQKNTVSLGLTVKF